MSLFEDIFGRPFFGSSLFQHSGPILKSSVESEPDNILLNKSIFEGGPKLIVFRGTLYRITVEEMDASSVKPKQKPEGS